MDKVRAACTRGGKLARQEIRRGYLLRSSRRINADILYLLIGNRQVRDRVRWLNKH